MSYKSKIGLSALAFSALTSTYAQDNTLPKDKPNILWLTSEDNNISWVGCYGGPNGDTPYLDKLASEGFQYMNAYANVPVCAPSRSTWITGVLPISMGTQHHRSRYNIPHNIIKYYPDLLRENGYYCVNTKKTDYNIGGRPDKECWDSASLDWKKLKEHQPFFQVANTLDSHESRAFGSLENLSHDPAKVVLHKYHPDIPIIRENYAKYQDAIRNMDDFIGKNLKALEDAGLADNTIVIYSSDHGGVLPRSKHYLLDSGIHAPLIIRIPEKYKYLWPADKIGSKIDRMVSFVDMPKTWLSITGSKVPSYMQGKIFLGPNAEEERTTHYAFRGRMDERYNNVRVIRDKRFLYIKNYMPYIPYGQHLFYLWKMPATVAWDNYYKAGKTDAVTGRFFKPRDYKEELYDCKNDPDNIKNIIDNPEYKEVVAKMRKQLTSNQDKFYDAGLMPEPDLARLAQKNNLTIYELIRKPELYNQKAYMEASDIALDKDPANVPQLITYMNDKDSGVRYWGIVGCMMLGEDAAEAKATAEKLLNDDSHPVRTMAAWFLFKLGEKDKALACLKDMLENRSYATLFVMNALDWIGTENTKPLANTILNLDLKNLPVPEENPEGTKFATYYRDMRAYLLQQYGITVPKEPKAAKSKSKKSKKKKTKK